MKHIFCMPGVDEITPLDVSGKRDNYIHPAFAQRSLIGTMLKTLPGFSLQWKT
jgi:hypothetical protein